MKELKWYFPETLEGAKKLLKLEGVIPHAGGTGILRGNVKRWEGLIDLHHLPLNYFKNEGEFIEIGAMQTYSDVVENLMQIDPESILVKSLSVSASTPLRNRITIGGSIAYFPVWSDLMGPLIALDAEVELIGNQEGTYPVLKYIENRYLRKGTLIKSVRFRKENWVSYYFRATRTHFDYSSFNITILVKKRDKIIDDARLVVVGNTKRYRKLTEIEKKLRGKAIDEIDISNIAHTTDVDFKGKKLGSPEYVKHLFEVELERGLEKVLRS